MSEEKTTTQKVEDENITRAKKMVKDMINKSAKSMKKAVEKLDDETSNLLALAEVHKMLTGEDPLYEEKSLPKYIEETISQV